MSRANGNGKGSSDLMVELIHEVRAMRKDMNTGFRALIKLGQKRYEDHERRIRRLEEQAGLR